MNREIIDSFERIHAPKDLVENTREKVKMQRSKQTIQATSDYSHYKPREKYRRRSWIGPALAACLLVIIGFGFGANYRMNLTPVSYVSVDVNPSIELCLNRKDKVIEAEAWNDDGEYILSTVDVKGKSCEEALECLLGCDEIKKYLTKDADLHIAVIGESVVAGRNLENICKQNAFCREHHATTAVVDKSLYDQAHEHGMSFGKYLLYLQLKKLDVTVTPDHCRDMSVKQITDAIHACENAASHHTDDHTDPAGTSGYQSDHKQETHHEAEQQHEQETHQEAEPQHEQETHHEAEQQHVQEHNQSHETEHYEEVIGSVSQEHHQEVQIQDSYVEEHHPESEAPCPPQSYEEQTCPESSIPDCNDSGSSEVHHEEKEESHHGSHH